MLLTRRASLELAVSTRHAQCFGKGWGWERGFSRLLLCPALHWKPYHWYFPCARYGHNLFPAAATSECFSKWIIIPDDQKRYAQREQTILFINPGFRTKVPFRTTVALHSSYARYTRPPATASSLYLRNNFKLYATSDRSSLAY